MIMQMVTSVDSIVTHIYESPYGDLLVGDVDGRICLCDWVGSRHHERTVRGVCARLGKRRQETGISDLIREAERQLDGYFSGERRKFDLPLLLVGTEFQQSVWRQISRIPYGVTISYGEEARRLGSPRSVRAVANANGANPISVIIPCHRIVGADGSLTGYGGGLDIKRQLIDLETRTLFSSGPM